ncbi:MAG TPA: AMP-binding protein [Jatrophihabitans sp.]|jgi:acyl-CoA synthetase (AMP-forming)/AMP-acid ligase II|uniref:AMP-binding protein n=1 Tax=Jatrophihabitans sp. TaxID=1932789 RepID=UPI002E071FDA|nr:AMP-binding protein [Jatrophihabitans sp.]
MTDDLATNLITRVNIGDALTRTAGRVPDHPAIVDGERRFTYAELNAWVNRVAHGLAERGYTRGDALGLASGNSVEFLVTYFACAKLGVVCVPMNLGWRPDEIAYVLDHSESRGIVVEAQLLPQVLPGVEKVPAVQDLIVAPGTGGEVTETLLDRSWTAFDGLTGPDSDPEHYVHERDAISYLYTSGTTSFPKGVVGSHLAIYTESLMVAAETGLNGAERIACLMPLFHTAQLNGFGTPAIMMGATQYLLRGFDPDALLDLIERESITRMFALPMMYRALVERDDIASRDLSSLRMSAYAMAPMPDALLRQCLDTFRSDFYLAFGQTEMSPVTTFFRPEHQLSHSGAVGTQVVNVQIGIMADDGTLLPRGDEGEIVYRGPQALNGYLKNPDATAEAFAHGWFHSGDVGRLDPDGMLWFSDRHKDVIKTGGENVASIEVEKAVYAASPDIAEAVVVGLPHPRWSEAITAVVVAKPGVTLDEAELLAAMKQHVDGYKVPKSLIVVDELPKTSTGKIQKNVVRQQFVDHYEG